MSQHELVIDIETAPIASFKDLPADQQHYLLKRGTPFKGSETVDERLNMSPLYGKIIAIGMWLISDNRGCVLFEGEENQWMKELAIADQVFIGSEKAMLDAFWKICGKYRGRIITWNGRGFDVPYLYLRSAVHDVVPSRNIMGNRYSFREHCDLYEVVTFYGASQVGSYSLRAYAHAFGIPHESQHEGHSIKEAYEEGVIEEIAEFCMDDVKATYHLYQKLKPVISVLAGG